MIILTGLTEREAERLRIVARVVAILASLGRAARGARVTVSDQNGPKGGVAIRCAIDAPIARRASIHVDAEATSVRGAVTGALDKLERRVRHEVRRLRDGRRRPKKYFVAAVAIGGGRRA
jgi:ribosome-associated translation inhibitor RaiA